TRYSQLKYLEEQQLWDDYFANGNTYRDQILESAKKVISATDNKSPLRVKARLLLWQFYSDQQGTFGEDGLDELIEDVNAYAQSTAEAGLLKDVADKLLVSGEKPGARRIYKTYVDKLATGKISDAQLKETGDGFYKDGNLELAEEIYNIYIDRISKKMKTEELIKELFDLAGLFVYKPAGQYDMSYAEGIYARIEGLGTERSFDQESIYMRAFNLEKLGDYKKAGELYSRLIQLYPDSVHSDEAVYKIGVISAYTLADIAKAREYLERLIAKITVNPHVISGYYQLGLLAQWEGDLLKAKEYYEALLKNSGEGYAEMKTLVNQRLKEIEENRQIEYALRVFMDAMLKKENIPAETGSSELKISSFVLDKGQSAEVSTFANMPESGCNQVQLQYLWSGDLGGASPEASDANFKCSYQDPGTKEINLVIISPAGVTDSSFVMVDVN
ncbi:MAG: tetratricopeptide repeat protein, partial [Candidatus Omnitrophica bacterium]|nr:tetratricopeptide repeat protein [Candidatus Omnitrophota bacterium]